MSWKWISGISVIVIVTLLVTAYIILCFYDYNKLKPQITEIAKKYTGRDLTIEGDITLRIGFSPALVVKDIAFQNASWGSRPQMAHLKRLEVQVDLLPILNGNIHVRRLRIVEPAFLFEVDKDGKMNLDFDFPKEPESETAGEKANDEAKVFFGFKEVQIEGCTILYNDHQIGKTTTINIEKLELNSTKFGNPAEIDLKANYNKTSFQVTGTLGQLSGLMNANEPWPFNLTVTAMDSTVSVAGNITDIIGSKGIDLELSAKGSDLANFQQITGKELPVKGPFEVSGHLNAPNPESVNISEVSILLGESVISGDVTITQKPPRPRIDARLYSKKLDLRPFLNQYKNSDKPETLSKRSDAKKKRVFSDEPFDLHVLRQVDAAMSFHADQILTNQAELENLTVNANLQNGHLLIKPLKADIGGSNLSASLDLVAKGNHVDLTTDIIAEKVDLGEICKKLGISKDVEGILALDINLTGEGNSVATLMAGMNGDLITTVGEGKMPLKYLNLVGANLKTNLTRLVNPFKKKTDRHRINCAVLDFNIIDGMAKSDIIMIDDPHKTLFSGGVINLKTEALDFDIQTKPKKGVGTKRTGKFNLSLRELTKQFKLSGTLAEPSLKINKTRTTKTTGTILLGPAGWASLLVSRESGKQTSCEVALEIAGKGTPETKTTSGKEKRQKDTSKKKKKK